MQKSCILLIIASMLTLAVSCVEKEPGGNGDEPVPGGDEMFDFSTEQTVTLSLDYGFSGYSINFDVYVENPLNEDGLMNEELQPIYGAYTDASSQFSGTIKLPAYVDAIYVCSDYVGVPRCIELDVVNGVAAYKYEMPILPGMTETRAAADRTHINIAGNRTVVSSSKNLYGLYDSFAQYDAASGVKWWAYNSNVNDLYTVVNNSEVSALVERINRALPKPKEDDPVGNSQYCSSSDVTNLRIVETADGGTTAHIDIVYLDATGDYENAMGYYYYPTGSNPTAEEIKALPKFVIYPMTHNGTPDSPVKTRLQFFGEDGMGEGTDDFPAGYTIGWILFCNIYNGSLRPDEDWFGENDFDVENINSRIEKVYGANEVVYSNNECNNYSNNGCITLTDDITGRVVIGFEDYAFQSGCGDKSYNDILFYVEADPEEAIYDPDRPVIPDPEPEPAEETYMQYSTLGFEDIWPNGGDYDLNDVLVEHTRTVTYIGEYITKIEDAFKVTNEKGSADYVDAFGFTVDYAAVGEASGYAVKEENNQFIMFEDGQAAIGNTYTLTRTFGEGVLKNANFDDHFNPFVVSQYVAGDKNRVEIHLPGFAMTSWANSTLADEGHNAYYISDDGNYPFAIKLENARNWEPVTEGVRIGSEGEYSRFNAWVADPSTNADWYLHK